MRPGRSGSPKFAFADILKPLPFLVAFVGACLLAVGRLDRTVLVMIAGLVPWALVPFVG